MHTTKPEYVKEIQKWRIEFRSKDKTKIYYCDTESEADELYFALLKSSIL
jgi:hypothetical protein